MMDKELEEAQNLTKDDLVEKLKAGTPANLARRTAPRDPNQRAKVVVRVPAANSEDDVLEVRVPLLVLPPPAPFAPASEIRVSAGLKPETAAHTSP
jgi:hypothetical protein